MSRKTIGLWHWALLAMLLATLLAMGAACDSGDDDDDDDDDVDNPAQPAAGEALFTEIMYDPLALEDIVGEWVELLNTTQTAFNLRGCVFSDENEEHLSTIETDLALPANGYLILGIGLDDNQSPAQPDWTWGEYNLGNSGDTVSLTCSGEVIDQVVYDEAAMDYDPVKGASLALCPGSEDTTANDDMAAWRFSTSAMSDGDLGTPREANDPCQ
ncbi:MAG: lamin tail domain-containing protein [Candidatus Alcyoniella australis]|nr:lamin tail domain-containing protein [Candidatus Alcyoniella australis]